LSFVYGMLSLVTILYHDFPTLSMGMMYKPMETDLVKTQNIACVREIPVDRICLVCYTELVGPDSCSGPIYFFVISIQKGIKKK